MMGIHRLTSGGADYYLADLAQELPVPVASVRGPGQWAGSAAAALGLSGPIDPDDLRDVLDGRHPGTGRSLRPVGAAIRGYDLTFSAPKSVSVIFALGGEEVAHQVLSAHQEAVEGALSYVETHGLSARRGSGEARPVIPTSGLIGASFTHGVSRNLDPHLHTHVVMPNLVHGVDSRWSACDQRGLTAHRSATSAVYDAHLRSELTDRLALRWVEVRGRRLEAEVSPVVMGEFSSRSADMHRHMAAWGSRSGRGARIAWAATRPDKERSPDFADISDSWRRRAAALGSDLPLPEVSRQATVRRHVERRINEHRFAATLSLTPDGAARRRDLVGAFATGATDGARASDLERLTELWLPPSAMAREVGVHEQTHGLRGLVPGSHLIRALGPRPVGPAEHEVWRGAASALDRYRDRWGVHEGADPLGVPESGASLTGFPTDRLVDHLRISAQLDSARRRLGWRVPRQLELDRGR